MVLQKKIGLDLNEYKWKNCTEDCSSGVVCGTICWTAANRSGFDAALGFGLILNVLGFLCLSGWGRDRVVIINKKIFVKPFRNILSGLFCAIQRFWATQLRRNVAAVAR